MAIRDAGGAVLSVRIESASLQEGALVEETPHNRVVEDRPQKLIGDRNSTLLFLFARNISFFSVYPQTFGCITRVAGISSTWNSPAPSALSLFRFSRLIMISMALSPWP